MAQKAFSISQTPPYTIPAELYDEAYRLYQRKYLLWKNWILEGILTLLTVDFIVTAVKDPSNGLTYFLMVLCVVLLALLIFHPLRIRRRVMDAVKEMGELPYVAALSEQEIVIQTLTEGEQGEEIPPTVLEYDEKMQKNGIITNTVADETLKAIPTGIGLATTCVRWTSVATGKSRTKEPLSAFVTMKRTARILLTWRYSIPLYSEAS